MSATQDHKNAQLVDTFEQFYRDYYDNRDGGETRILDLAQRYPNEQRSLEIDWQDLYRYDPDLADDFLNQPEQLQQYAEEALRLYDIPIDVDLGNAHVRVGNLPPEQTYHPGEFSPSKHLGKYRGIRGEVTKASDVYPKIEEAAFECQLCGTLAHIPQSSGSFQEPHECQGCERQGPFEVLFEQSEFVDAQKVRIKVPPELTDGAGQKMDAFIEDDIAGLPTIGDRVVVAGIINFEQEESRNKKKPKFEPYLTGEHITIEESDQQDLDVSNDEKRYIRNLANGEEGNPFEIAPESLAPKIFGYETEKLALILSMVSGGQIIYPTGDTDRTDLHVLLLGDPGTAKSKLIDRAYELGWRTVMVSSKRASIPGLTAAAEQDDFGDGEWSLKAGAFVKANGGTVCIDELDDMDPNTRAGMLEPMSNQKFTANVAGESVTFQTEASVVAAGNPKYGRFDPYEPIPQQFDFDSALISRFDLVYTIRDKPNEEDDRDIADHMLDSRDATKRWQLGEEIDKEAAEKIKPPVDEEIFPKWIALARQQPNPPFESTEVKEELRENFLEIRGLYDYDEGDPIPVTFRKLEGIVRVAEAAAKLEFSEVIEERHARLALKVVGRSMEDIGKNEDGDMDADVHEIGESKNQKDRKKALVAVITDLQDEYSASEGVPREEVVEELDRFDESMIQSDMDSLIQGGEATQPRPNETIRYLGQY